MRIRIHSLLLFFFTIFVLGCGDSSPLKSDLEVAINQTFDMQFDYLDHVQVYKSGKDDAYKESILELNGDGIRGFVLTLSEAKVSNERSDIKIYPYKIVLSTSAEGKAYNKKQTFAEVFVYPTDTDAYLSYEDKYYKLTGGLKSFGIE